MTVRLGPDAQRYWIAGGGDEVAKPFHLRWLLPAVCKQQVRRWWAVWALSWPILFGSVFWLGADLGWQRALLAAVLCCGLPGVWGPSVVRPVGVDLPGMALGALAAALIVHGHVWPAVIVIGLAAQVKESMPVWAALWAWNPVLLVGLAFVVFNVAVIRPGMDAVTAKPELRAIHDHPVATALRYRSAVSQPNWPWWRNFWIVLAPWGVCLAALYRPDWRVLVVLGVAHLQLLVATDTARLLHTAAGPAVALAAAAVLPGPWLLLAGLAGVCWATKTEVM